MAWTEPQFSRKDVDRAGKYLVAHIDDGFDMDIGKWNHSIDVINNWRSSHSYPLQVVKMTLKGRAKNVYEDALVAQRLKRLYSTYVKLRRNEHMSLSQMQDIGGCRAVLPNVRDVEKLVAVYEESAAKNSRIGRPVLVKPYDYINHPKTDGYRSYHFVYKYQTESGPRSVYNGHRVEIQIRSRLQHAWATAVETVDIATSQALKTNVGESNWKRFFALMGSAIALRERRPLVPNTPTLKEELADEIRKLARQLNVEAILTGIGSAIQTSTSGKGDDAAYLLVLDAEERRVTVKGYAKYEIGKAQEEYADAEREIRSRPGSQAVLVSVDSLGSLATAFPNFFLDTVAFLDVLKFTIGEKPQRRSIRA